MSRLGYPVLVVAAAAALAPLAAGAARDHRYELAGIGLSVALPASWHQPARSEPGWNFVAERPDGQAKLYVKSYYTAGTFTSLRTMVEAYARKTARAQDPHARFEIRATRVAGTRAVEIVERYADLTAYLYGFQHDRHAYVLDYVSATAFLTGAKPVFAASLRSLRFLVAP